LKPTWSNAGDPGMFQPVEKIWRKMKNISRIEDCGWIIKICGNCSHQATKICGKQYALLGTSEI